MIYNAVMNLGIGGCSVGWRLDDGGGGGAVVLFCWPDSEDERSVDLTPDLLGFIDAEPCRSIKQ